MAIQDAWLFDGRVNRGRIVHDGLQVGPTPVDADQFPAALAFSEIHPVAVNAATSTDLGAVFSYLDEREGNLFLLGDTSVLYGITGRPSVSPVLWFHPGLTIPVPGGEKFPAFERELIAALEIHRVRIVVVEGRSTWMGVRLDQFPELLATIRARTVSFERFGPFAVYELDPPFGE
jgi:hypothetical protein